MVENASPEEYFDLHGLEDTKKGNFWRKLEAFLASRYFVAVCVVLVAIIGFSVGRLSKIQDTREPVRVYGSVGAGTGSSTGEVMGASTGSQSIPQTNSGQVVASKNGTKYHYPWCAGAKQISDKNKITFNSIEEARQAGYTPASNCKGLK